MFYAAARFSDAPQHESYGATPTAASVPPCCAIDFQRIMRDAVDADAGLMFDCAALYTAQARARYAPDARRADAVRAVGAVSLRHYATLPMMTARFSMVNECAEGARVCRAPHAFSGASVRRV